MSVKRLLAQLINKNGTPVEVSDGNRLLVESAGVGGGALATEGTLVSVLNAIIASDQDIEILLVRDTGNSDEVVQQITNYETGTPVVSYKDVNGAVYVPVGPLEYLDPSAVLNLILTESLAQGLTLDDIETNTDNLDAALTALFGTLGQKASAGSAPVVLSTEQELLITTIDAVLDAIKLDTAKLQLAANSDVTAVASSATSVTLKASNTSRKSLKVTNDADMDLLLKEGTTASASSFTWRVLQGETVIIDDYTGIVDGIWEGSPTGNALVTEITF